MFSSNISCDLRSDETGETDIARVQGKLKKEKAPVQGRIIKY